MRDQKAKSALALRGGAAAGHLIAPSVEDPCGSTPSLAPRNWPGGAPAKWPSYFFANPKRRRRTFGSPTRRPGRFELESRPYRRILQSDGSVAFSCKFSNADDGSKPTQIGSFGRDIKQVPVR